MTTTEQTLRSIKSYTERLSKLHTNFTPHEGQITAGRAYFEGGAKFIFLQCGRNFGKSLFGAYCAARHALLNKNSAVYIIGPKQKQQSEIIWHSGYLKRMIPSEYLGKGPESYNQAQLRVWLDNGSFIKIDGSDNEDDLRGYKPDLIIIDEFKDWRREAYQAMEPNLKAKNATVIIVGTPPDAECFYTQMREFMIRKQSSGDKKFFYLELPTASNPHISRQLLEETRFDMVERGEEAIWEREYMARFVPGGAASVFPKFSLPVHVKPSKPILEYIRKDIRKLQWFCVCDPGTTTVFAVLFAAINPFTGQIFLLDEIYERDRAACSTSQIWERIQDIIHELNPRPEQWTYVYDEAAAWFSNEVLDKFGVALLPTTKRTTAKENQISLIRDIMRIPNKLSILDTCKALISEIRNYVTDKNNKLPRTGDHLIDCFRYLLSISNYELNATPDPDVNDRIDDPGNWRNRTFEQDFLEEKRNRDPFSDLDNVVELEEEDAEWLME